MGKAATAIPPLIPGDHLTVDEFLRRWEAMPEVKRAELIDGIVYMPSPISNAHSTSHSLMDYWLGTYVTFTPGCESQVTPTCLLGGSSPQPDLALRLLPEFGGSSHLKGIYPEGAAELVVEICYSSASHDLGPKLALYERAGVQEYVAVLLHEQRVEWRRLVGKRYRLFRAGPGGVLRSHVFPGLWLDPRAAILGERKRVLEVLQQGLDSPEHVEFVQKLAQATG